MSVPSPTSRGWKSCLVSYQGCQIYQLGKYLDGAFPPQLKQEIAKNINWKVQQSTRLKRLCIWNRRGSRRKLREDRKREESQQDTQQRSVLLRTALFTIQGKLLVSSEVLLKYSLISPVSLHPPKLVTCVISRGTQQRQKRGSDIWDTEHGRQNHTTGEIYKVNGLSRSISWEPEENVSSARCRTLGRLEFLYVWEGDLEIFLMG